MQLGVLIQTGDPGCRLNGLCIKLHGVSLKNHGRAAFVVGLRKLEGT